VWFERPRKRDRHEDSRIVVIAGWHECASATGEAEAGIPAAKCGAVITRVSSRSLAGCAARVLMPGWSQRADTLCRANPCPSLWVFYLVLCLACSSASWPWVFCAQEDHRIMLLEDGPARSFSDCNITVSPSFVDRVVLELIGPVVTLEFDLFGDPRFALIFRGGPRLFKTEELPFKPSRSQKRASAERVLFQLTLRDFSSAD
jgi:hypothetical protein